MPARCVTTSPAEYSDSASSMRPASILERSSTSLIRRSRCLPLVWMSASGSPNSAGTGPYSPSVSISVKPRIAFSGVRSSWLMLARNSDFALLACSSRSLSAPSSRAARRCSSSSRASSREVALSCAASSPNSSRLRTVTEPPKRPAASSPRKPCAACNGRISVHEMTKPPASASSIATSGGAADDDERALVGGAQAVAQADHARILLLHQLGDQGVDRAVERILAGAVQPRRQVDLPVAHEIRDVGDQRHRLFLPGADLLNHELLGILHRRLEVRERLVEAVVLAQDRRERLLVAHQQRHGREVHLHRERMVDLLRPVEALMRLVEQLALPRHAAHGVHAERSHGEDQERDAEEGDEQLALDRPAHPGHPANHGSQRAAQEKCRERICAIEPHWKRGEYTPRG